INSHFGITEVISDTHSLFSFQRSTLLRSINFSSPATLILYHIQPIIASSFLISYFEQPFDLSWPELEYTMYTESLQVLF
ncbi:hypothetical protein, partial [Paenibacillus tepidiphilus]|uniref:hypothetical protein n=1 Tax=Paenibacillus tepidiphilus TaxID=2608683 RepID=UPI00193E46C4